MYAAAGLERKSAAFAISSTSPRRKIGSAANESTLDAPLLVADFSVAAYSVACLLFILLILISLSTPSVPPMAPGTIPTTRTLCGPHSTASTLVKASTPALAAAL